MGNHPELGFLNAYERTSAKTDGTEDQLLTFIIPNYKTVSHETVKS